MPPSRVFIMASWVERGQDVPLLPDSEFRLTLWDGGSLTAHPGCGTVAGRYALENGFLRVAEIEKNYNLAEQTCGADRMRQDERVIGFLQQQPAYTVESEILVLTSGTATVTLPQLILPPATPRARFDGWIASMRDGGETIALRAGVLGEIDFRDDGSVAWTIGECASGASGWVSVDSDTLTFERSLDSQSMCTGDLGRAEQATREVLSARAVDYRYDEPLLRLLLNDLELVARRRDL